MRPIRQRPTPPRQRDGKGAYGAGTRYILHEILGSGPKTVSVPFSTSTRSGLVRSRSTTPGVALHS